MNAENVLLGIAAVAAVIATVVFGISVFFPSADFSWLTGRVSDTATINLTVESSLAINFTTDNINWGSGKVSGGSPNATLDTSAGANNVSGGNWTGNTAGLIIANIGNVIVNLSLKSGKNATTLLAGSSPYYQYNVTNNEGASCIRNSTGFAFGLYYDVNTTGDGTLLCDIFNYTDTNDTMRIDIRLVVPSDSVTGALSDTITATAA